MSSRASYSQMIGGANTSAVSALVRQLKNGEITKQQLFDQLSKLHSESTTLTDPDAHATVDLSNHRHKHHSDPSSQTSPKSSVSVDLDLSKPSTSSRSPAILQEPESRESHDNIERLTLEKRIAPSKTKRVELQEFIESGSEALKQSYDRYRQIVSAAEMLAINHHVHGMDKYNQSPNRTDGLLLDPSPVPNSSGNDDNYSRSQPSYDQHLDNASSIKETKQKRLGELLDDNQSYAYSQSYNYGSEAFNGASSMSAVVTRRPTIPKSRDDTMSSRSHDSRTVSRGRSVGPVEQHGEDGTGFQPTKPVEFNFSLDKRRLNKTEKVEMEQRQKELSECTFQPRISEKSLMYVSKSGASVSGVPFAERALQWQKQKNNHIEKARNEVRKHEKDICTFRPNSARAELENTIMAQVASKSGDGKIISTSEEAPVCDRLYSASKQRRDYDLLKQQLEDEQISKTCTFQPKILTRPSPAKSRYLDIGASAKRNMVMLGSGTLPNEMVECTFVPKTNAVPRSFGSAQLYLEAPAFERLSRQRQPITLDSVYGFSDGDGWTSVRPSTANGRLSRGRSEEASFDSDSEARNATLQNFLDRQQRMEQERQLKLQRMSVELMPSHEPMLCKKSLELTIAKGGFLDRLAEDSEKRLIDLEKSAMEKEAELTFKPAINPKSHVLAPRNFEELSTGDQLRRQAAQEAIKLKVEQTELSEITFHPKLNFKKGASSRLKLLSDPNSYLSRLAEEAAAKEEIQEQRARELELKEMEGCTFRPQVHDAPTFVKRIAASMRLVPRRAVTMPEQEPQWR